MRKRIFDLIFVILLSPLILFIFFITFLFALIFNRKNIFFFQSRGGYKGEKIQVIKFRTMENQTHKISNFNNFLRKSRLDEIPQFLNVLKGDLSIVGPRPLHYEYKEIYSSEQKKRFNVKPGLTGLAQIKDSYSMTWSEQFKIDIWYTENNNLLLDIKIIIKTLFVIIKSTGKKEIKDKNKFNGSN
tara:strand:+ start:501 stop:1058 length:558 start_codon:yes stop_codon:yes gene_type:complete